MLKTPPKVQSQLSESLSIICGFDFPTRWPTLLPELVQQLTVATAAQDFAAVGGVLATANSIFKRYRNQYRSVLQSTKWRQRHTTLPAGVDTTDIVWKPACLPVRSTFDSHSISCIVNNLCKFLPGRLDTAPKIANSCSLKHHTGAGLTHL